MEILIRNEQKAAPINRQTIRRKIRRILKDLACPDEAELSLLFTDDAGIAEINAAYLDRPRPTNVISFSQRENALPGQAGHLLGDVVVSVETAAREAAEAGESLDWAVDRLVVHGILHLSGYDHEAPGADAAAMEQRAAELMALIAAPPRAGKGGRSGSSLRKR